MHPEICDNVRQPEPATKAKPDWWHESDYYDLSRPHHVYGEKHRFNSTIKSCPAIADTLSMGYILFLPLDIEIDATDDVYLKWRVPAFLKNHSIFSDESGEKDFAGAHASEQLQKLSPPEGYHRVPFKINTYFGIKTDPGYSVWVTHPMYNWDLPFTVMDGIIDTDKITSRFPYPLFVKKGFNGVIPKNTPLIQVIPFKREEFELEFTDFNKEDTHNLIKKLQSEQIMSYRKHFWERKSFK